MLVLSRKEAQRIALSCGVEITVVRVGDGKVKLGFDAPKEVRILRKELVPNENSK